MKFAAGVLQIHTPFIDHFIRQMRKIIDGSYKYGTFSDKEKQIFVNLIKKNGSLPRELRKDLWILATGAEQAKRNNPRYFMTNHSPSTNDEDSVESPFGKLANDNKMELVGDSVSEHSDDHASKCGQSYHILDCYPEMPDPYTEQIELDLKRTFTEDENFTNNRKYQTHMLNILLSYAKRNSSVGYCQGMNYLAGILVRVVEDQESAFWVF